MTIRRPLARPARRRSLRLALEPRIVFDGAAAAGATIDHHDVGSASSHAAHAPAMERHADAQSETGRDETIQRQAFNRPQQQFNRAAAERDPAERAIVATDPSTREIAFVDASVVDIEAYLPGFKGQVITLKSGSDGFDQIAAALAGQTGITAIHILGHGGVGSVSLGDGTLDATSINTRYAADLAVISRALTPHGDILLYACDVAAGAGGQAFISSLAAATGDDVAASTDATGAATLGGNWVLEAHVGVITAKTIDASGYNELLLAPVLNLGGTTNALIDGGFDNRTQPVLNGDNLQGTSYGAFATTGAQIDVIRVNGTAYAGGPDNANTGSQYVTLVGGGSMIQTFTITSAQTVNFGASFAVANPAAFVAGTELAYITNSGGVTVGTSGVTLTAASNGETFFAATGSSVGLAAGTYSFVLQTGAGVAIDSAFVQTGGTYNTVYAPSAAPLPVAATTDSVTSTLGTTLASAAITIANPQAGDLLSRIGTLPGGIVASAYNAATSTITLTGTASLANYSAALGQIGFSNSTATPATVQRTINVTVNDGLTNSNVAQNLVTIDYTPVAVADSFGTPHNVPIVLDVRANDTDANLNSFTIDKVNGTAINVSTSVAVTGGVVSLNAAGSLVFTPTTGYTGSTSFTYNVIDAYGKESAAATVSGTVTDQAPVIDLNSTSASNQDVVNGTFTGSATGFTATGSGTYSNNNYYYFDTDGGTGTLTQSGLTNLNRGYGTHGAAAVTFDLGWNNGTPDNPVPATLDLTVGGVLYARFTTNPAGGNGSTAQVGTFTYFNGASGPVDSVNSSAYLNWTFTRLTVNLPSSVAATGDLVLTFNAGTGGTDDIAIDNVSVLTRTDPVAGINYATSYTENAIPVAIISPNGEIYDNDDTILTSATIVLTNAQAGDVLTPIAFNPIAGITISQYNESTHTVTLTGNATAANYLTAIQTIGYSNVTDSPATTARTITVTLSDGIMNSAAATTTVSVVAVNDVPIVNVSNNVNLLPDGDFENTLQPNVNANNLQPGMTYGGFTANAQFNIIHVDGTGYAFGPDAAYSGSQYVDLTADATVTASFTLASAQTVSFGGAFSNRDNTNSTYSNPSTTISILNSSGTVVAMGSAVSLSRASGAENWYTSNGMASLAAGTYTYSVSLGNFGHFDALYVRNVSGYTSSYTENAAPTLITAAGNSVTDLDNPTMQSATITLTNAMSLDVLSVVGTLPTGITASAYNATTGVLTLTGNATDAAYATAIAQVGFSSTSENPSATPRIINIVTNDGISNSNTAVTTINVIPVNDAPTSMSPASISSPEDTTLNFTNGNALSVADVDSPNLTVTLNVGHGTLTLGTTTGLTFTTGNGNANAAMTFSGTQAQLNAALASLTYRPSPDYNGTDALVFNTNDGSLSANKSVALTVTPVADITADTVTTVENMAVAFNAITGTNGATPDTFSDPNRAVTSVTQGANGMVSYTAAGILTYTPNTNFAGTDTFTYTVTAGGTTETATETVNVVDQPPTSTAPTAITSPEDTTLAFTNGNALSVADSDNPTLSVTLTVGHGNLTLGTTTGLTFTTGNGNANATMTFSGTQAQLNTALASLTYRPSPDYNGSDALTFNTSDGSLTASKSVALTVTPVADITADTVTTNDNTAIAFNAITGTNGATPDTFSDPNRAVTSVTQGSHGTVSYTAAGVLTYTPNTNYSGTDTFTYTVTAGGTTETATETVNVVDQPPTSVAPTSITSPEDTTLSFTNGNALSVADVDNPNLTVTLTVTHGTLTLGTTTGLTFTTGTGSGNTTMTFSGTKAQLNTALGSLTYRPSPDYNGSDALTFNTTDGTLATNKSIALTVTPVADITADTVTTNENAPIAFNAITGTNGATADTFSDPSRAVTSVTQGAHGTVTYTAAGVLTYTPNTNYSGTDTFNYTVTAGGTTETATETVNVTFVNQAPTSTAPASTTSNEDTTLAFTGANALSVADVDTTNLTVTLNVGHGTVALGTTTGLSFSTGNGTPSASMTFTGTQAQLNAALASLTYRPSPDYNGNDTLTFNTSDGSLSANKSVTLMVTPVADITADTVTTNENTAIAFNAITGTNGATADTFSDPTRAVTSVTQGAHGSVSYNANGVLTYTPNANYSGTDTFNYTVTAGGTTETATETVNVTFVNQAPTSTAPTVVTSAEDTTLAFTGGNALSVADVDSPNLSVTLTVTHGTLTLGTTTGLAFSTGNGNANTTMTFTGTQAQLNNALSSLSYRPSPDYNGSDALAFSTSDGSLTTNKSVALTVTPVADITADTVTTGENAAIAFNAITGTNGATADTFSDPNRAVTAVTQGANGTVSYNANGTLTYTPNANFSGNDTFTYTVTAGGTTETATETVRVTFLNQAPIGTAPMAVTSPEDTTLAFTGANRLSVTDVDSPNLSVTLTVAHGTLTLGTTTGLTFSAGNGNANATMTFSGTQAQLNAALGSLTYRPGPDYNGSDTLAFNTSDGSLASNKSVALTITPVADITADTVTTNENAAISFNAITGTNGATADTFSDPNRAVSAVTQGAHGTVSYNANGTLTYTPNANYSGTDTFNYTVSAGGTTETATETVRVTFVNQAPTSTAPAQATSNEDTTLAFTGANALSVADVDSPNLTVTLTVGHGTLTLGTTTGLMFSTGNGSAAASMTFTGTQAQLNAALASLTYRPSPDYNGSDALTFNTSDGSLASNKSVALTITPVADITADTVTTNEITALAFNAITGTNGATADTFSDPNRAVTSVTQGAHGSVSYNANGTLTYTPNANYSGTDTFNYTVTAGGTTETATETVNVTFVNQAPTSAAPAAVTSAEDTTLAFTGGNALSVADVDSPNLTVTLTVGHGTLTLGTTAGLSFGTGTGSANTTMTFTGTQAQLNNALSSLSYRPNPDYNGSDALAFSTSDGSLTTSKSVALTVTPVADITADTVATNENTAIAFNAITGTNGATADTFADPNRAVTSVTQGAHGTVSYNANGTLTYTPNANYSGSDTFTYTVSAGGTTETATETVNVTFVNQAPTSTAPTAVTSAEDTTLNFTNSNALSVADVDSPNLSVTLTVTRGTLTLGTTTGLAFSTGNGNANTTMTFSGTQAQLNTALASLSFRPNPDYNGNATLSFTTSDGSLNTAKSVALTITPVADITADTVTTNENTAIAFNAITGTNGATPDTFSDPTRAVTSVTQGAHGSVSYNANGTLTYTPNANYSGTDTFNYTVSAGGVTETATETVNVTFVNQAPTSAAPTSVSSPEDTTLAFTGGNALSVADVDSGNLTVTLNVAHGTLTLGTTSGLTFGTGNGTANAAMTFSGTQAQVNSALASLTYRPNPDYNGSDALTFNTSDGSLASNKSVALTVTPVADITADSVTTAQNLAIVFNAITGTNGATADTFSDPNRAVSAVTQGAHGSVSYNANGALTYTPNTNYSGTDTFTYTVTAGGTTETATETVTVGAVNQAPTSTAPTSVTSAEDTTVAFTGGNALSVSDVDSPTLTVTLNVGHGTLALGTTTGLTFSTGNGTAAASMTFSGTQAQLNAALASLSYRPGPDYNGSDTLGFSTSDGSLSIAKSVALTITPVADITADTVSTNENTALAFNAITGTNGATADTFSDPSRAVTAVTQGTNGSVSYNANGTLTYTPNANFSGTDTFTYTVTAGGTTETATETVNVAFVDQAPTSVAPTAVTVTEDTTRGFRGANALSVSDVDSPNLTVTLSVGQGTLTLGTITGLTFSTGNGTANTTMTFSGTQAQLNNALSSLNYRANPDYNGSDTLAFTTSDGSLNTAKSIALTITPVADITADTVTTNENTAIAFNAITGTNGATADTFSDPNRAVTAVTQGANGTVVYNANGTLTYTPNANFSGTDTFTYTVTAGGTTETATETVNVTFVDQAPTSTAPTAVTSAEDNTLNFTGGNSLSVADVDSPNLTVTLNVGHGTLTLGTTTGLSFSTGNGTANASMTFSGTQAQINTALASLSFRPNADFNGSDTLAFTTSDGSLNSVKSVALTITPVADITADTVTTNENMAIAFNAITGTNGATADTFSDPNRAVTAVTQGTNGTVGYNANGTLTYTPNANFSGTDSFNYTVTAGGTTETATETVHVTFVNQAPTSAAPTSISSAEDTTLNFNGANALSVADVDSPTLTVSLNVAHGMLTLGTTTGLTFTTGNGTASTAMTFSGTQAQLNTALASLSFRPDPDYNGSAVLGFTTSDGSLTSVKNVALTITPVADITADTVSTNENTTVAFNAITGTNGATPDTFSDPNRAITSVTQGVHGSVSFTAAGVITYTPNTNYVGSDSYSYTVTAGGSTETASITMNVVHIDQAPVANNDTFTVAQGAVATINVRANDTDADGDTLTVTMVNGQAVTSGGAGVAVTGGTVALGTGGDLVFTPTASYRGSTSFTYTVADPSGVTSTATVSGTVTPVNHAPVAANDTATVDEDHNTSGNILANDSDPDGDTLSVSAVNGNAADVGTAIAGSNGGLFTVQANGAYTFATNGQFEDLGTGQSRTTTVTYTAADGLGGTANATVTITVTGVNDAPVANPDSYDTTDTSGSPRGLPLTGNVVTNDTDAEHDTITVTAVNGSAAAVGTALAGSYGTLTLNANGTFSYAVDQTNPAVIALLRGQAPLTEQFTYTDSDGNGGTSSTTLTVRVQGTNDGPMAGNDSNAIVAGQANASGNVITGTRTDGSGTMSTVPSAMDIDPGFTLNVNAIRLPGETTGSTVTGAMSGSRMGQYGTITIDANGNYTYALNNAGAAVRALKPGQPVAESFVYQETDGVHTTEATITISIDGNNQPPVAQNDTFTTAEGTAAAINVRANDSDPNNDPIRVTAVNGTAVTAGGAGVAVTGGTVTLNTTGDLVYTPSTYYRGSPSFTYTIEDPSGANATATVNGTVTPVNHAPTAAADTFSTSENAASTINVLSNDSDVDGDTIAVTQVNGNAITAGGPGVVVNGGVVTLVSGSLVFTPDTNFTGSVAFNYTIADPSGATSSASVNGNVAHVNQPPVAVADSFTSPQNTTAVIDVRANDSDPDGDALTVTQVNGTAITVGGPAVAVTGGTVILDNAGKLEFTPTATFRGNTSFSYTVADPFGATGSATVSGTVTGVNHAPVANPDTFSVAQGSVATIDARANDTDADGDILTITQVNGTAITAGGPAVAVTGGTVILDNAGKLEFTPTIGYTGSTSFAYTVSDPSGATSSAAINGTVTPSTNHAPVAVNDAFTISANTVAVVDVRANDADVDGDPLTVTQINGTAITAGGAGVAVTGGVVTLNAAGNVVFTPTAGFAGTTSFTYTERDPSGAVSTASVAGTVTLGLHEPMAVPDAVSIPENAGPTVIDVRGNDIDVDNHPLTITQINGHAIVAGGAGVAVAGGTVTLDSGGNLVFTPTANVNGPVSFSYTISDPSGSQSSAAVSIAVTPAAGAPMAAADTFTVAENAGATAVNVRANDVDSAGLPLTITQIDGMAITAGGPAVAVAGGSVTLDANGNLFFTPTGNTNGPVAFSYTVSDPSGSSSTAGVSVNVAPGAHAPVANPDSYTVGENSAATVLPVRSNDTDPDNNALTVTQINGQAIVAGGPGIAVPGGVVNLDVAGKLLFVPTANFNGPVTFSYTISDAFGSLSTAGVSLSVVPLDIGPVARPDTATGAGPVTVDVLSNDTDASGTIVPASVQLGGTAHPGDPLVIAGQGTFTIDPNTGAVMFTPVAGFVGTATATYTVADSNGLRSSPTPLSVTTTATAPPAPPPPPPPGNHAPVANPDTFTVAENTTTTINVLANDTDADGNPLTVTQVNGQAIVVNGPPVVTAAGSFTLDAAGNLHFTPTPNYSGPVSFSYTIRDPSGATATASVSGNVTPVFTAPLAAPDTAFGQPGTPITIAVLDNDRANPGDPIRITAINGQPIAVGGAGVAIAGGVVTLDANGNLLFIPSGANGSLFSSSFTYTITSQSGFVASAGVTLDFLGVTNPPVSAGRLPVAQAPGGVASPPLSPAVVLQTVGDVRGQSDLVDVFDGFTTDVATSGEIASNLGDHLLQPNPGPYDRIGLIPRDANLFRENANAITDSLFVQHAVRYEDLADAEALFVQHAVRQSQAEAKLFDLRASELYSATVGGDTVLDPFAVGVPHLRPASEAAKPHHERHRHVPHHHHVHKAAHAHHARATADASPAPHEPARAESTVREAQSGFTAQLKHNGRGLRTTSTVRDRLATTVIPREKTTGPMTSPIASLDLPPTR